MGFYHKSIIYYVNIYHFLKMINIDAAKFQPFDWKTIVWVLKNCRWILISGRYRGKGEKIQNVSLFWCFHLVLFYFSPFHLRFPVNQIDGNLVLALVAVYLRESVNICEVYISSQKIVCLDIPLWIWYSLFYLHPFRYHLNMNLEALWNRIFRWVGDVLLVFVQLSMIILPAMFFSYVKARKMGNKCFRCNTMKLVIWAWLD